VLWHDCKVRLFREGETSRWEERGKRGRDRERGEYYRSLNLKTPPTKQTKNQK
jgi:hypothetical protein